MICVKTFNNHYIYKNIINNKKLVLAYLKLVE